jgi:uncharacterized protein YlzI (FlbEa/FlbD family)
MTTRSYQTTVTLIAGQTYTFKVEARNNVGYSSYSQPISIIAARLPSVPATPTTLIDGNSVVVSWTAPYNGGSRITGYTI